MAKRKKNREFDETPMILPVSAIKGLQNNTYFHVAEAYAANGVGGAGDLTLGLRQWARERVLRRAFQ